MTKPISAMGRSELVAELGRRREQAPHDARELKIQRQYAERLFRSLMDVATYLNAQELCPLCRGGDGHHEEYAPCYELELALTRGP